ncbi:hypothetical protein FNF29_04010 [Cafeteria roenbergensis]|uniref:Helicase ATP-binding domain-containing protein n=1 Tax=Cafeteria roenbergensis TaxID=33653 RepID=A0A5A8CGF2_CAFRO|nr:hypothetical protein FNF29_04010 [Cafeteria roenbergensis]|eukprot:KAA0152142.1 hypothetical protein FNF29_04010 [Cafeteria roenbergensis]
MTTLGSRKQYCVHHSVSRQLLGRDELCRDLLRRRQCPHYSAKTSLLMSLPPVWDVEDAVAMSHAATARGRLGGGSSRRVTGGCPFYAARDMVESADLILCPYTYLINPSIRAAMSLQLSGAAVVLDEAHNIEDQCREAASFSTGLEELKGAALGMARAAISAHYARHPPPASGSAGVSVQPDPSVVPELVAAYRELTRLLLRVCAWAERAAPDLPAAAQAGSVNARGGRDRAGWGRGRGRAGQSTGIVPLDERPTSLAAELGKSEATVRLVLGSDIMDEVLGRVPESVAACARGRRQEDVASRAEVVAAGAPLDGQPADAEHDLATIAAEAIKAAGSATGPPHSSRIGPSLVWSGKQPRGAGSETGGGEAASAGFVEWVDASGDDADGLEAGPSGVTPASSAAQPSGAGSGRRSSRKRAVAAPGWIQGDVQLDLWCLNAAVAFSPVQATAHSVLLTSGTLSPADSFASELGTSFPVRLSAPHHAGLSLLPSWVSECCGVELDGSAVSRKSAVWQDALGRLLVEAAGRIPGGLLVFFPSYDTLTRCVERWAESPARMVTAANALRPAGEGVEAAAEAATRPPNTLEHLAAFKRLCVEPRSQGPHFKRVMRKYVRSIRRWQRRAGREELQEAAGVKARSDPRSDERRSRGAAARPSAAEGVRLSFEKASGTLGRRWGNRDHDGEGDSDGESYVVADGVGDGGAADCEGSGEDSGEPAYASSEESDLGAVDTAGREACCSRCSAEK